MSNGTQISDMTSVAIDDVPSSAIFPFVVPAAAGGLSPSANYVTNVIAGLLERPTSATLAASGGSALIGTIQTGTGAVARTEASKLNDIISVKDFGAVGDGTTDDTAAIQAALDVGTSHGNAYTSVFLPPGDYRITNHLLLQKNHIRIFGAGDKSCFVFDPPATNRVMLLVQNSDPSQLINYIALEDFGFRAASGASTYTKTAIKLIDASLVTIRNVNSVDESWVSSGTSIGVHMCGRDTHTLDKCTIIADKPIYVGLNPNSVKYTFDYHHFSDLWLQTMDANSYAITFIAGAFPSNWIVDGDCVALKGKGGVYLNNEGTVVGATGTPSMVTFDSFRVESGTASGGAAGGYGIYMDFGTGNNACSNVWIKNGSVNDPTCNGYLFKGVTSLSVDNVNCGFAAANNAFIVDRVNQMEIFSLGIGDAAAVTTFTDMDAVVLQKLTGGSATSPGIAYALYVRNASGSPENVRRYEFGVRKWGKSVTLSNAGEVMLPSLTAGGTMLANVSCEAGGAVYFFSFTTAVKVAGPAAFDVAGAGTVSAVSDGAGGNKLVNVSLGASKPFYITTSGQ